MISTFDDKMLTEIALSRGYVAEDEVRECQFAQQRTPEISIITILMSRGHLAERDFLTLLKIHANRELMRGIEEEARTTPEKLSSK